MPSTRRDSESRKWYFVQSGSMSIPWSCKRSPRRLLVALTQLGSWKNRNRSLAPAAFGPRGGHRAVGAVGHVVASQRARAGTLVVRDRRASIGGNHVHVKAH